MADVEIQVEEEVAEKELNPFMEATRKVLLAGVGVVALAQEEAESFVNKLVERGELAEKEGRQLIKDLLEKRRQAVEESEEVDLDARIERILHRLNVPTKTDINALSRQITALAQKVDELKESKG
jgi:poly(hydroxyalkanoate) granule-associated protein